MRDGLVGVKRMEKAYQRQVIYGGSLDTILLEMNLIPEERLTQYLALASGLPPAARDEGAEIAADAVAVIDKNVAEQFRAVPLDVNGDNVRILVCAPLELSELEDLADLLDRPLQPLITPEYRWHLVFARAYGLEPQARFLTLAKQLEVEAAPAPVGRAKSIIVDEVVAPEPQTTQPFVPAPPRAPAVSLPPPEPARPPPQPAAPLLPVDADQPTMKVEDMARGRSNTLLGMQAARPNTDPGVGIRPRPASGPPKNAPPSNVTFAEPLTVRGSRRSSQPIPTSGRESPLAIVPAREQLATAEDRDTVFLTLLRAARARVRYAGLLTVQGGAVIGRVALAEVGVDTQAIQNVLIPLDTPSPFRTVVHTHQPHIGPLECGDPAVNAMIIKLGGTNPPSALLLPLVLRERVVSIVVAHRVHSDLKLVDVTELLPLASAAADALGRLIVKHKSAGYRTPSAAPQIDLGDVDTKKIVKDMEWRAPAPADRPTVPEIEMTITAEPPRPIADVIDEIENAKEGAAEDAIADAVERAQETLGELIRRFPGKLRVDRFAVTGRALRAAQYGGLLDLVVRLGSFSSDVLIEQMASANRDARFYATVCAAELRPRNAIFALVERLFDQDFGVRAMAIEALAGYPIGDLSPALAKARRALHATDPEQVVAATSAVVELGDTDAVSDLIGVIERGDRASDHVRKALVTLTAQDFGTSERKWRKWYEGARKRHRIEWLIDSLTHKEDALREAAINDLRRLTGEYFGYHHDLPKKERELAAERWVTWWRDTGQRRFVYRDDERLRPTGILPARKEP
ncbi:MAG: hypothetical protein JO257_12150 [Deltaproteobacteria bacterium]|nr:hypothetical protein [Deltaproteobacteria bacterium]